MLVLNDGIESRYVPNPLNDSEGESVSLNQSVDMSPLDVRDQSKMVNQFFAQEYSKSLLVVRVVNKSTMKRVSLGETDMIHLSTKTSQFTIMKGSQSFFEKLPNLKAAAKIGSHPRKPCVDR